MNYTLFLLLLLSIPSSLIGQSRFFEFLSIADSLYEINDYYEAAKNYSKAFEENPKIGTKGQYFKAACCWSSSGKDNVEAIRCLRESISRRMYDLKQLDTTSELSNLREQAEWSALRLELITSKQEYENGINKPMREQLLKLQARDQTLRKLFRVAMEELSEDSLGRQYYQELVGREDSICQLEIIDIIEHHGWLGISKVGEEGNRAIWLIIQHAPLEIQEKYAPLMEASVKNGESNAGDYAYLIDRIKMRKGEPQIYGSQYRYDRATRERYFYKIANAEGVNARRESVGLFPIEEYARLIRIEYNPSIWEEKK